MSIQMPPAQDLFNVLNQHYATQYTELGHKYTRLEETHGFFCSVLYDKHTEISKKRMNRKVANVAGEVHDLIIASEQLKILANLLGQGVARLNRPALAQEQTFSKNLTRINPSFATQCTSLFDQNVKNVQILSEAQRKVSTLEETFQKYLHQELLPAWEQFAKKFGTLVQEESLNPLNAISTIDPTPSSVGTNTSLGILNVATSAVSSLASGMFSIVISGPKNSFEPKYYLAPEKVKPLPSMEDLTTFFNTHRPQSLTESPIAACDEAIADFSKDLTCTAIYQNLHALFKANCKDFNRKWKDVGDLLTCLDSAREKARQKTGDTDTLKKFGEELQTGLVEIGSKAAQYKVDLKAIQALELYLKIGVEYLTLQPIPTEDQKTIEILDGKFWTSVSQAQVEQQKQLAVLKKDLEDISELKKNMEGSCALAERMYQDHRYQVSNLRQGYLAKLGIKQLAKVHGTYVTNPTDPKLPEPPVSVIQLKNFDSKEMELLSTLDHESCLIAVLNRVQISAFDESEDSFENEGSEKLQEETLSDVVVDKFEAEIAADAINVGDQQKPIGIHETDADKSSNKTSESDEVEAELFSVFIGNTGIPKGDMSDFEDISNISSVSQDQEKARASVSYGLQQNNSVPVPMAVPVPIKPETPEAENNSSAPSSLRKRNIPLEPQRKGGKRNAEGATVQNAANPAGQPIVTMSHSLTSVSTRQPKRNPFKRN